MTFKLTFPQDFLEPVKRAELQTLSLFIIKRLKVILYMIAKS